MSPVKNHTNAIDLNGNNTATNIEQKKFYQRHNHCSLCASQLTIDTKISSASNTVHEKVSCPKCKVTISTSENSLN